MKATLEWDGMDEIKRYLLALPEDLAREGAQTIAFTASACAAEIRAAYPVHSGNLRGGVRCEDGPSGRLRVGDDHFGGPACVAV